MTLRWKTILLLMVTVGLIAWVSYGQVNPCGAGCAQTEGYKKPAVSLREDCEPHYRDMLKYGGEVPHNLQAAEVYATMYLACREHYR